MIASEHLLHPDVWLPKALAHEKRVDAWADPHRALHRRGESHPVYDFLFTYYSFTPGQLRRWHPGCGVTITGPGSERFLEWTGYAKTPDGVTASPQALKPARREFFRWLLGMLEATEGRPALFACYGLHEWAMLYRADEVRHSRWPLRLPPAQIAAIVESQSLCCTHFDAFRFFAPEARPLNRIQPERARTPELEQRGCLHANMDLYKWAYKLTPLCPSSLIADCFELAREIREVDMRASPYDFTALGFAPIRIEEAAGRALYERLQRDFSLRSVPLRGRLIGLLREVVHSL
ncbi:MAG TPA: hypothetical protein VHY22_00710 [Chthoniobacteraceae bacterium]|jgi:hypothetical protein|nr:hypothetical protein [Chthoniobacteraceae bacterium]